MSTPLVRDIEQASLATWCALETEAVDGCVFAANDGYTGRANSVTVLDNKWADATEASMTELCQRAEGWYRERGLPPTFRLSPLGAQFRKVLGQRGYEAWNAESNVLVRTLTPGDGIMGGVLEFEVGDRADQAWFDAIKRSAHDREIAAKMFAKAGGPAAFVTVTANGDSVATGQVMLAGEIAMIYGMFTAEKVRGQGIGAQVLAELHCWASAQGATTSALQVVSTNEAAQRLYVRDGYERAYRYHYLRQPNELLA